MKVARRHAPPAAPASPIPRAGLTLTEVLMSLLVTGIGVMSVIVLLPLSFVRAVQATNLTNSTILRYNAESQIDTNLRFLLRWQPSWNYAVGDTIVLPFSPPVALSVTTAGVSGMSPPAAWNTVPGGMTTDNTVVWTAAAANAYATPAGPAQYPGAFVIDPLGWNTLAAAFQAQLGNTGAAADPRAVLRFNAEISGGRNAAAQAVTLPDSWAEQFRGPVSAYALGPPPSVTLNVPGVDLSGLATYVGADGKPGVAGVDDDGNGTVDDAPEMGWKGSDDFLPPATPVRIVLSDLLGRRSQTRLVTGRDAQAVYWSPSDPLLAPFSPAAPPSQARVETQEMRYTWMATVRPSAGGGTSNVDVTVFFRRSLTPDDERVYAASGADGVTTPFTVQYGGLPKPFAKKGGFLFDCYFGRWYRITDIQNDTGAQFDVYVDRARPQSDVIASPGNINFGAVFMRGIVDVYPLSPK